MRPLLPEEADALREMMAPGFRRIGEQGTALQVTCDRLVARGCATRAVYPDPPGFGPGNWVGYSPTDLGRLALRVAVALPAVSP